MRYLRFVLLMLFASLFSCHTLPPERELPPEADLSLDELNDMQVYTEGMVIACGIYKGERTEKIVVNGSLHDDPDLLELHSAGYYRIKAYLGIPHHTSPTVIRIVILDPERGNTEWGLPPWTPQLPEFGEIGDQEIGLVHTPSAPPNISIPLVVLLEGELTLSDTYLDAALGTKTFRIKRGVGSVQIPENSSNLALSIDNRTIPLNINDMNSAPQALSGVLTSDTNIPAGAYINIPSELTIPEGITLSIGSGSFITIDPEVNIINNGLLSFAGSASAPITVTCSDADAYWGGFIGNSAVNHVEARHTIFCRSGHHTGGEYSYGHAGRQALFYSENGELMLDHCYMIDHIGQVFYPVSCTLELTHCLVQRAKTGGQINESELLIDRCIFTDFPDDSYEYRDEDNDGLYVSVTNAVISNSVFMFAKDDGLDSGASGGGEVLINNCRFEANFHEGAALSSGHMVNKLHRITNSVFTNCGQGLELGYSSPNHRVEADSCLFEGNGIGIRYGDCYEMPHHGYIHVTNSQSLDNIVYDVWNMNREHWAADTSHMSFDNVQVTKPNAMYPELILYE